MDDMLESALKEAARLRAIFDIDGKRRNRQSYPVHFGWAILYRDKETDKYELCPCNSEEGLKYKWCCMKRSQAFRRFLKKDCNELFIYGTTNCS